MTNPEHLAILEQGAEVWNKWRKYNPETRPDLRKANLYRRNLCRMDLDGVDFSGAILTQANFSGANLREAYFSETHLNGIYVSRAADLVLANLSGANIKGANLGKVDLGGADLSRANLSRANLSGADLGAANLNDAILIKTDLSLANLNDAILNGADLSEVYMVRTTLGDVDLGQVIGLKNVRHHGPSTIGIDTIYKSAGNIPEEFLRGAGVPDQFIAYARSLIGKPIEYYSAFISHSHIDKEFADRLYDSLQRNDVRTWYAPEDLKIGEKFRPKIDESIRLQDKLLLVLSEHSVTSDWVEHEVETALAKEREKKKTVLFPVRVDDTVMDIKTGWPAHVKNTRHIGDFRRWIDHDAYQEAFERLLWDLKAVDTNEEV